MLTQNFQIGFCLNSLKNKAGLVFAGSLAVDRVGGVQMGFAIVIMSSTLGYICKKSDGILHFQLFLKFHLKSVVSVYVSVLPGPRLCRL